MNNLIEIQHRVSSQLSAVNEEKQIYQIMNDGIGEIIPDAYFLITKFRNDDFSFRIIHRFGFDKYSDAIKTLIGKDPLQMDFPINNLSALKQKEFKSKQLVHFPEGISGGVGGKLNKTVCNTIENILGISGVFAISLCIEDKIFGGATIFIPKSTKIEKNLPEEIVKAIESIAFQASLAINKLRDYKKLLKKEAELKIVQSRFNQIINQVDTIVWQANGDGTGFVDLNNSFKNICGYCPSLFVKKPYQWFDLVHMDDESIVEKANEDLIEKGNAECEYRIITSAGKTIWLHEHKSVIFDKDGTPIQMRGIAFNITETKLLEERFN